MRREPVPTCPHLSRVAGVLVSGPRAGAPSLERASAPALDRVPRRGGKGLVLPPRGPSLLSCLVGGPVGASPSVPLCPPRLQGSAAPVLPTDSPPLRGTSLPPPRRRSSPVPAPAFAA